MNWIGALARTYDLVSPNKIGTMEGGIDEAEGTALLPVCHSTNLAHIEISLSARGELRGAVALNPAEPTIIPCTEESGGRAGSKPKNHPLSDKLQYLAGDFPTFGGTVTSGFDGDPAEPFRRYVADLEAWSSSPYAHPKMKAVLAYVKKSCLIADLVKTRVLYLDNAGRLLSSWPSNDEKKPAIFKVLKGNSEPCDAFVRWRVQIADDPEDRCWADPSLWKSWIDYYTGNAEALGLCYATGTERLLAKQHPAKIRNSGDKAKLISSNDGSGFTYRGRFVQAEEACGVGLDVTQKAHNALRWLFARQGDWKSGLVAWALTGGVVTEAPSPAKGVAEYATENAEEEGAADYDAGIYTARKFRNKINGYRAQIGDASDIVIMGLDSATPGRMSITVFKELKASEYLERLAAWHGEAEEVGVVGCVWLIDYGYDKERKQRKLYFGAPSPRDIALACYGPRANEKLLREAVERLLSCIIDTVHLPLDIVNSAIRRVINRPGSEDWEWRKTLGIACALYRKHCFEVEKRRYEVALEEERTSRDYLFGRLLALAEHIESIALRKNQESERQTNAERYMVRFAERPCETWMTIELKLKPYLSRLGRTMEAYRRLMDGIVDRFQADDFMRPGHLGGEFLLGYHCQRTWLSEHRSRKGEWVLKTEVLPYDEADDQENEE